MKTRNPFVIAFAMLGAAAAAGCSGSGMSRGTIHGNVTSDPAFTGVSGAVVTAWHVDASGQLTQLQGETTSDASGAYELVVEFAGSSIHDVVVKATTGTSGNFEGEAIVSSSLSDGGSVSAPSMTGETKVQADVYVQANVDGEWDSSTCSTASLASEIDASIAGSMQASADYAGDVAAFAKVVVHGMKAHASAIADGVSAALAAQAQADAEESVSGSLTTSVMQQAVIEIETAKAQAIGDADASAMTSLGTSASDVVSAQSALTSSIQSSGGASSSIASAWSTYDAQVKTDLKAAVDATVSGGATAIDDVESSLSTVQATLTSSLSAAGGDPSLIASAYAAFGASLTSTVQSNPTLGTMSSGSVSAVAQTLASLDVNG